jgi:hypothetical protein
VAIFVFHCAKKGEKMHIELRTGTPIAGTCKRINENLIKIELPDIVPTEEEIKELKVVRESGELLFDGTGYDTIYKTIENGYILSNDGSVYVPPAEPDPEPVYEPTLDELKTAKKQEVSAACEETIARGIDVQLPGGVEHFSLTANDQINLIGSQAAVAAGEQQIAYHEDGKPCRYYTPTEISLIVQQTMFWIGYHRTYCNSINMWIQAVTDKEDLQEIYYGADVPEVYQSDVLKDYIMKISKSAEKGKNEKIS